MPYARHPWELESEINPDFLHITGTPDRFIFAGVLIPYWIVPERLHVRVISPFVDLI